MRILAANTFFDWLDTGKLAIIVSAITALVGTLGGPLLAARSARAAALHQHRLDVDDEARRDRKAVYLDLLLFLNKCIAAIGATHPLVMLPKGVKPPPWTPPSWPDDESKQLISARMVAHASDATREAMRDWEQTLRHFMAAAWVLDQPRQPSDSQVEIAKDRAQVEIEKDRDRLFELTFQIRNTVNAELNASR